MGLFSPYVDFPKYYFSSAATTLVLLLLVQLLLNTSCMFSTLSTVYYVMLIFSPALSSEAARRQTEEQIQRTQPADEPDLSDPSHPGVPETGDDVEDQPSDNQEPSVPPPRALPPHIAPAARHIVIQAPDLTRDVATPDHVLRCTVKTPDPHTIHPSFVFGSQANEDPVLSSVIPRPEAPSRNVMLYGRELSVVEGKLHWAADQLRECHDITRSTQLCALIEASAKAAASLRSLQPRS